MKKDGIQQFQKVIIRNNDGIRILLLNQTIQKPIFSLLWSKLIMFKGFYVKIKELSVIILLKFCIFFFQSSQQNSMEAQPQPTLVSQPQKVQTTIIEPLEGIPPMKVQYDGVDSSIAGFTTGPFDSDIRRLLKIQSDDYLFDLIRNRIQSPMNIIGGIYYQDPVTGQGDAFQRYGKTPIYAQYKPTKIELYDIKTKSVFMDDSQTVNRSPQPVEFDASLSVQVTNSTESTWNAEISIGVGYSTTTSIDILLASVQVNISANIQTTFGKSQTKGYSLTVGKTHGVTVIVPPGRKYLARLSASLGTAKAKITYEAELKGQFMAFLNGRLGAIPTSNNLKDLLPEENIKTIIEQNLDISTYSRGVITVYDVTDGYPTEVFGAIKITEQK